jgi:hypothetical protein
MPRLCLNVFGSRLVISIIYHSSVANVTHNSCQLGRNVIGLDMEASAFLQLCNSFEKLACLGVVKGVSDFGDEHKKSDNKGAYEGALINTAKALEDWIRHRIPVKSWEEDYCTYATLAGMDLG